MSARAPAVLAFVTEYSARYGAGPTLTAIVAHARDRVVDDVRAALEQLKRNGRVVEQYRSDMRSLRVDLADAPAPGDELEPIAAPTAAVAKAGAAPSRRGTQRARVFRPRGCKACSGSFIPTGARSEYCKREACVRMRA